MPSGRRSLTRGSAVDQPSRRRFPVGFADIPPGDRPKADGFSFTTGKAPPRRRVAPQALFRFKARVRELTRRTKGVSLEQRIEARRTSLTGWSGCFGFCQTPSVLRGLDQGVRRRLRAIDRSKRSIHSCKDDGQEAIAALGYSGRMDGIGSGSCSRGTYPVGSRHKPQPAPTVPGGSLPARLSTSPCPTRPSPRSAYPPWPQGPLDRLAHPPHQLDRRRGAHLEPPCRLADRAATLDRAHDPPAQIHRYRCRHPKAPS